MIRSMLSYIQGAQLCIGVLVAYTALERSHSFLGLDGLGAYDIRNLQVEGDIFTVTGERISRVLRG